LSPFDIAIVVVGIAAGAVASIAGFGVGSLLTPLLATTAGAKLAVALVSVPHAIATLLRLWRLRHDISWPVLRGFGIASAAGGLAGAYVFTQARADVLGRILGALLIFVGGAELAGVAKRFRVSDRWAWMAGAASGMFGGMVGNQGGIRSAGLLTFGLAPRAFVATAAAIALIVDAVRVPVYALSEGAAMLASWRVMLIATVGVVIGTFAGAGILMRLPADTFRRVVGAVLLVLGVWMVTQS
jgi:uncharacterized membrane protein YfcA